MTGSEAEPPFRLLSFVLPVFNEEAQIEVTLAAIDRCASEMVSAGQIGDYEVICVDDGSSDGTAQILAELASDGSVRVVTHAQNRGLGAAVRSGLGAARGDCLFYTDSDLPFDLSHTVRVIEIMSESNDVAVCLFRNSRAGEGPRRFVYSYVYNYLVKSFLGIATRDVNFAGKYFRADALDAASMQSEGSLIDVEILANLLGGGATIRQFGVDFTPRTRGISTLSSVGTIITMIKEMAKIGPELRRKVQMGK